MGRRSKVGLTVAGVLAAAVCSLAVRPVGAATSVPVGSYTLVIGDSLSNLGREELAKYRPTWRVDGVNGRKVTALPGRIDAAVANHGGKAPGTLVVALGTNEAAEWAGSDYRVVRSKLPGTRIVFVTPYRDAAVYGPERARVVAGYAYYMLRLANGDPRACVVPWAEAVGASPWLLRDGVHATAAHEDRWAREVVAGVDACRTTEP
jgi:hypothetical protein